MHSSELIPRFHKLFYRLAALSPSLFLISPVVSSSLCLLLWDLWTDIWDLITPLYLYTSIPVPVFIFKWWRIRKKKQISGFGPSSYQISFYKKEKILYSCFCTINWDIGHEILEKGKQKNKNKQKIEGFQCLNIRSSFSYSLSFPSDSDGKASSCNAGGGWEDLLEKEMATHSSIFAWRIPWTEEPGRLQSMGCKESDTTEWLHFLTP